MNTLERNLAGRHSLAVLCPVYNEEQTIPLFFGRISQIFAQLSDQYQTALYFIDNGCSDASLNVIRQLHEQHPYVYVIVLSRNFGYQCAMETGLRVAKADLYVMIDVDCEDPPEMIIEFLRSYKQGYDIVYGERVDRPESVMLKFARHLFYHVVRRVADDNFVLDMAEFSLITAEVRDAIIGEMNSFPFLRASMGRIGFRRKNIPYKRHTRIAGETHYNVFGMTVFAIAGMLSASTLALRIPAYVFPFWLLIMVGITLHAVIHPSSWNTPVLLLIGFVFIAFSVTAMGLYVARVYKNGMNRPNAIVRHRLSVLPSGESET